MAHSRMNIDPVRRDQCHRRAGLCRSDIPPAASCRNSSALRDWATLIGGIVASLVLTIVKPGLTQLVFAGITGALIRVVVVGG